MLNFQHTSPYLPISGSVGAMSLQPCRSALRCQRSGREPSRRDLAAPMVCQALDRTTLILLTILGGACHVHLIGKCWTAWVQKWVAVHLVALWHAGQTLHVCILQSPVEHI